MHTSLKVVPSGNNDISIAHPKSINCKDGVLHSCVGLKVNDISTKYTIVVFKMENIFKNSVLYITLS